MSDELDTLRNWQHSGGTLRVLHLSDAYAVVELCTCAGERMDSLTSSDHAVLAHLKHVMRSEVQFPTDAV